MKEMLLYKGGLLVCVAAGQCTELVLEHAMYRREPIFRDSWQDT